MSPLPTHFPSMWLRWEVEVKERGFCMKSTTKHCIHQAYSQWRTDRPEHPFRLGRTTQCTWPLPPGHGQGGFKTQITFIFTGSQTAQFKLKYGKTLIKCHLVWIDNHIPAVLKNRSINDLAREEKFLNHTETVPEEWNPLYCFLEMKFYLNTNLYSIDEYLHSHGPKETSDKIPQKCQS